MRTNRIRAKLGAGKPIVSVKMNVPDPIIADIIGLLGFDCIWLCNEHGDIGGDRLGHLIRTAAMNGVDVVVRVARGSYSDYVRPLELGASALMVPHCIDLNDARQIVRMTRFHPLGRRPLDGGNSDGQYCMIPVDRYIQQANDSTFIMVQIEDPEVLPFVDEIAALDGIDALFVGTGDLSHGFGYPGQCDHPEVIRAIAQVNQACRKHHKIWGLPVTTQSAPHYLEMGARFLYVGADVIGLSDYFGALRKSLEKLGVEFTDAESASIPRRLNSARQDIGATISISK